MDLWTALINLPLATQVIILASAHCLIGFTATAIAYGKGYSFSRWLAIIVETT